MTKRILSVDDSPTIRKMIEKILTAGGYEVVTVDNGQVAIGLLEAVEFDMVITDLNMNVMSGLTFINKVRALPKYAAKPIIFVTTENSDEVKREGRARGATGWVTKPFDPHKLLRVVNRLCPLDNAGVRSEAVGG